MNGTVYRRSQDTLLTPDEAEVEYLWPYSLGADGVVIWSGQGEKNALDDDPAANASFWANFLNVTGPMTQRFVEAAEACSAAHCSGPSHGRCMPLGSRECQCAVGWSGVDCSKHDASSKPAAKTDDDTELADRHKPSIDSPKGWKLENLLHLDAPAGRYTQARLAEDGKATIVWNGDGKANSGLRIARCADSSCSSISAALTVPATDPNPRYIRLELDQGSLPVLAYGAKGNSEMHLTRCTDALCRRSTTTVLAMAQRTRHCDLRLSARTGSATVITELSNPSGTVLRAVTTERNGSVSLNHTVAESSRPYDCSEKTSGLCTALYGLPQTCADCPLPTGGLEDPTIIQSADASDGRMAVAYWDVAARSLRLVFGATGPDPVSVVAAQGFDLFGKVSSPGAWVKGIREPAGTAIALTFFDLATGELQYTTCDELTQACTKPLKADVVGRNDTSDYGAGAFPELRQFAGFAGPALAYFTEEGSGAAEQGVLKLLACADARCSNATVAELSRGPKGYGRDCSMSMSGESLLVSFLDLQGKDEPDAMVARLGVFRRAAPHKTDDGVVDLTASLDLSAPGAPLPHLWSRCLGSGHAALTMREDWRNAVRTARRELGLEMVRFHGLLDDDMSVSLGPGIHSWLNIDSLVDFLIGQGMRSVLELSFMPSWMASNVTTSGMQYHPNNNPPANFTAWGELIGALAEHLVERYGVEEMSEWYFEVWVSCVPSSCFFCILL